MKVAIIDIGSNSVRLAMLADGKTLYKRIATTRLGEGISAGVLNCAAISRTVEAVAYFSEIARNEGADKVYAFATAAVRSASNGGEFTSAVKSACGVTVEVVSGQSEASLGLCGALGGGDGGIIDVGGASAEVTFRKDGEVLYSHSADVGAVRLFDGCGRDRKKLAAYIKSAVNDYGSFRCNLPVYAIGGTATTLASLYHGLEVYDPAVTHGTVLWLGWVCDTAEKLLSLSVEEVRALKGMEPRRADVIGGGCMLLGAIMEKFGLRCVTVSENDNIEGYAALKGII